MGWLLDAIVALLVALVGPLAVWLWRVWRRRRAALTDKQRRILAAGAQSDLFRLACHDAGAFIQAGETIFESSDPEFPDYLQGLERLVECRYLARAGFDGDADVFHFTARGLAAANQFRADQMHDLNGNVLHRDGQNHQEPEDPKVRDA